MKVVLDTNIFISAFFWGGNPQKIIDRIIEGKDILFISNEILNEIANVMSRPRFNTTPAVIKKYTQTIEKIAKKVVITGTIKGVCRDKDDDDKIECGVQSGADYVITGDEDLLILDMYEQIKIVTVTEYLRIIER